MKEQPSNPRLQRTGLRLPLSRKPLGRRRCVIRDSKVAELGPVVLLINGSINTGKTTVAMTLCRVVPRTAHVEVDALRAFIDWMPLEESIPLNLKNAAAVTRIFLASGLNVVVTYPFELHDYEFLKHELPTPPLYCFTLAPRLEVALSDRGGRVLEEWERKRIEVHYETGLASPSFGAVIDNSELTPAETVQKILENVPALRRRSN
jgi:hypothetical protein